MSGDNNAGRKSSGTEFVPKAKAPFTLKCPRVLPPAGKKYWRKLVKLLNGTIEDKDEFALMRLCNLYCWWTDCQKIVNEQGFTFEKVLDRGGSNPAPRPEANLMKQYASEIKDLERKFGLTPGDRDKPKLTRKNPGSSVRDKY